MESLDDYLASQDPLFVELDAARLSMHIPDLASAWLGLLAEDGGLPDLSAVSITHKGKPLSRPILEDPINTPSNPSTYPARLDNGEVIWVRFKERRSSGAPVSVSVVDKPDTVRAVLAALTVMEGGAVDIEQLKRDLPLIDLSHPIGISESVNEAFEALSDKGETARALEFVRSFHAAHIRYALALLRYYRPGFDALPEEEKRGLLVGCCERINKTIAAVRQLSGFLEYGTPNRDQRTAVEDPHRDVEVAVLRDVERASYRKIAARLRIKISEKASYVGDYSTVVKMAIRGRDMLERAFGSDGWAKRAAEMRAESVRRSALSEREKYVEDLAEDWRVSQQAAQSILEGEDTAPEITKQVRISRRSLESAQRFYKALAEEDE